MDLRVGLRRIVWEAIAETVRNSEEDCYFLYLSWTRLLQVRGERSYLALARPATQCRTPGPETARQAAGQPVR